jgi:hypothetical protein
MHGRVCEYANVIPERSLINQTIQIDKLNLTL